MVFFNCEACGTGLKKNQVEPHMMRCKTRLVSCIDCNKNFRYLRSNSTSICAIKALWQIQNESNVKNLFKKKIETMNLKRTRNVWPRVNATRASRVFRPSPTKAKWNKTHGSKYVSNFHVKIISFHLFYVSKLQTTFDSKFRKSEIPK